MKQNTEFVLLAAAGILFGLMATGVASNVADGHIGNDIKVGSSSEHFDKLKSYTSMTASVSNTFEVDQEALDLACENATWPKIPTHCTVVDEQVRVIRF